MSLRGERDLGSPFDGAQGDEPKFNDQISPNVLLSSVEAHSEIDANTTMKQGVVYILKCSNGSFYTGVTNNLEERLNLHQRGLASKFTAENLPVELVWNSDRIDIGDAILLEKQIKGWRREKKVALINHEYEKLPELARRYNL